MAPATIDDKVGLRPCFVNFRTTDDDVRALVEIALELGPRADAGRRAVTAAPSRRNTRLTATNPRFTPAPV